MAQAGEKRAAALFNSKAKWKLALIVPKEQPVKSTSPELKAKSGKGHLKKGKNQDKQEESKERKEEILDENDDVMQALHWAHDTLIKEFAKRKQIRQRKKSLKRRAHKKIQTIWAFHYKNDERKKAKAKIAKEEATYKDIYNKLKIEDSYKDEDRGKMEWEKPKMDDEAQDTVEGITESEHTDDFVEEENTTKRKVIIINLQKRLSFKRSRGECSSKEIKKELKTEEEKVNEARMHLKWLQEKQKQNVLVDFFGVPKSRVLSMTKSLSRHGSNKSNKEGEEDNEPSNGEKRVEENSKFTNNNHVLIS